VYWKYSLRSRNQNFTGEFQRSCDQIICESGYITFELVEKDEWKELISYLKHDIKLFGADSLKSYM
jgi:hypothetical protein